MAKVFISYSHQDEYLVSEYVVFLEKYGHTILRDRTILRWQ